MGTSYSGFAGTSQAAPHVSGTVALMQSARKTLRMAPLKPNQVLHILEKTAYRPVVQPDRRPCKSRRIWKQEAGLVVRTSNEARASTPQPWPGSRERRRVPLRGLSAHHHVIQRQIDRVGEGVADRALLLQMVDEAVDPFLR